MEAPRGVYGAPATCLTHGISNLLINRAPKIYSLALQQGTLRFTSEVSLSKSDVTGFASSGFASDRKVSLSFGDFLFMTAGRAKSARKRVPKVRYQVYTKSNLGEGNVEERLQG